MQQIQFNNILPHPLIDSPISGNFWNASNAFVRGSRYLIKADSGRGKSTLLNIIYGIRKDYSGSVLFDNTDISSLSSNNFSAIRSNKIAYLFQDLRLFPQLSAMDNILLKPGFSVTREQIISSAEKLGVANQLGKPCSKLSLGQQQRIALIRALSQDFEWLLLDEPFSHLDQGNALQAMEMIQETCKRNNAAIIATSLGDETGFQGFEVVHL